MIGAWIGIICFVIVGIIGAIGFGLHGEKPTNVIGGVSVLVVAFAIAGLIIWWLYCTEGGSRAQKTFESETQGGLYRTVKVYDMQGEQIQEYKGKFDIEENQTEGVTKIKFDCDGQRHIIYCSTGTVVIDEVGEEE